MLYAVDLYIIVYGITNIIPNFINSFLYSSLDRFSMYLFIFGINKYNKKYTVMNQYLLNDIGIRPCINSLISNLFFPITIVMIYIPT